MGLPDVQPMQAAVLAEIEKRLMAEAEKFSPEELMHAWFLAVPQGADRVRDMLGGFFAKANASGPRTDRSNSQEKD